MIIAISGKRGVGKTAAAKHLERFHGFHRVSFADELRRLSRMLFPFTEADMTDVKKKEAKFLNYDWTPRDFLINFGEFMRFHDKGFWCDTVLNRLKPDVNYVIDDMRFENEYQAVKDLGGILVRINRSEHENPFGKNLDIISETALDTSKFDFTVENCRNESLRSLCEEMDHLVEGMDRE